ncbi:prolyl-tRNA synthetase (EC 6.1.1.15), archaeal/eukaryal type [Nanoarchaeota archaeon]
MNKNNKKKEEDFSEWYNWIVRETNIIDDRYPVKGMPVYFSYGYIMIRNILRALEDELDKNGFEPYWFPVLIPYDIFKKESEHIKGFEKEVFYVTPAKPIEEEKNLIYILRPTSETEMYYMFSLWIKSHRDLPLLTYMTNTVYRYETKATKPLMRGREILWNEAHTVHKDIDDAQRMIKKSMEIYSKIFWDLLSVPHIWVMRPSWDKFAGADYTYAADTIMPDGRFLQIGTTHLLGRNFSKAFNIIFEDEHPFIKIDKNKFEAFDEKGNKYEIEIYENKIKILYYENNEIKHIYESDIKFNGEISEDNRELINLLHEKIKEFFGEVKLKKEKFVWQTSFGIAMRTLAAVISIHGDDKGLILPFYIAPIQIIIIPIYYSEEEKNKVLEFCEKIYNKLKDKYRVKIDKDDTKSPGWKFNQYEMLGVPIRISIGKKEIEDNYITVSVRKFNEKSQSYYIELEKIDDELENIIENYEKELKERAKKYFESKIIKTEKIEDIEKNIDKGVVFKVPFCMREECADNIKKKYNMEVRGTDIEPEISSGKCIFCNNEAKYYVYLGRSY